MKEVRKLVCSIEDDGLWGACELLATLVFTKASMFSYSTHQLLCVDSILAKLVPLAYGIKKLQISVCVCTCAHVRACACARVHGNLGRDSVRSSMLRQEPRMRIAALSPSNRSVIT